MNKGLKITLNVFLSIFVLASLFLDVFWIYMKKNVKPPASMNVVYANTITDENGNELNIFELNAYTNKNGNGKEMFELKINSYLDYSCSAVRSYIIQKIDGKFYYYVSDTNGVIRCALESERLKANNAWASATPILFDIDTDGDGVKDSVYSTTLSKTWTDKKEKKGWQGFWSHVYKFFGADENIIYEYFDVTYSWEELFNDAVSRLTKSNQGYSEYVLGLVDLDKYLQIQKFDGSQFIEIKDADFDFNFFGFQVSVSANGCFLASQSLAGAVADDFNYCTRPTERYYTEKTLMTIDETSSCWDYVFIGNSQVYLKLTDEFLDYLCELDNIVLDIHIFGNTVIDDKLYYISGFDDYGLYGSFVNNIYLENYIVDETTYEWTNKNFNFSNYSLSYTHYKEIVNNANVTITYEDNFNTTKGVA